MDAQQYRECFAFLEKLCGTLDALADLQREKSTAVSRDDLLGVEACMKREQALSLSLRSMEQKREKLFSPLGMRDKPFSALPEYCPPELRPQARDLADRVRRCYGIYRSAADAARSNLELNLHQIEKMTAAQAPAGGIDLPPSGAFADIRA